MTDGAGLVVETARSWKTMGEEGVEDDAVPLPPIARQTASASKNRAERRKRRGRPSKACKKCFPIRTCLL